jgi:hypothetical protein
VIPSNSLTNASREKENEALGHKKREPIDGSLVANRIMYTLFWAKNQALPLLGRRERVHWKREAIMLFETPINTRFVRNLPLRQFELEMGLSAQDQLNAQMSHN